MQLFSFWTNWRRLLGGVLFAALVAPAAWAGDAIYVVKRNDTLTEIARNHDLSVAALAARNGLSKDHRVIIGERLVIPSTSSARADSAPAEFTYVVKRGDTLYDIAKANRLSVAVLAERNGLSKNYHVQTGQRLTIPGKTSAAPAPPQSDAPSVALPESVSAAIRNASVSKGRWKYIVVHHSGVDEGTVKGMDRYHREVRHMENGLAYHFVIGNGNGMGDGEIAVGERWRKQLDGGHLRSEAQNKIAIGICLVGNFDNHPPSARQLKSLTALVKSLMNRTNLSSGAVKTHQQINVIHTECPGKKFPAKSFLVGLK